jgi:hypothetical protein
MSTRPICALAGLLVMACAPAFPARPELPPIAPVSADVSDAGTVQGPAPVIPKPDLSNVRVETQALRTVPVTPGR